MSGLNVLNELRDLAERNHLSGRGDSERSLRAIHDAVAELIAADEEYDAAQAHLSACPQPLSLNESGMAKKKARDTAKVRVRAATARRSAALAALTTTPESN